MSNPGLVPRTAPIAIAPKTSHRNPSLPFRHSHANKEDAYMSSMAGNDSADSDSALSGTVTPCESCALRGSKCVVGEDEERCVSCQTRGVECSLCQSPPPRKRKLARDLADESNGHRGSPGRSDNRRLRQHAPSLSSTAASNSLIEEMANFGGPTFLKRTLGLQEDRYCQYIGPTTDFEPSLINLSPFDPQDESLLARGTLRKVSDHDTFLMLPDAATPGYDHQFDDVDEIERLVAPHGRKLLQLYFEVVHPGFPILQKNVFMEKYDRNCHEFSPAVLAAVYIIAVNWWDHSEELSKYQRPNIRELERLIRSCLADAMFRPKLSTVQAGLLLSQRPEGDQWAPTAQLVAIAQELGLHLDCTHWKIPPWEKGLRKRLAWGLYMQDKWGALVHGRPSHIFSSNWTVQPLAPNDFSEADCDENDIEGRQEIERGRTLFVQMVYLSQVLAEILETFYTLQAMQNVTAAGPQGTHLVLSLAKPIQLKLKEWYAALPAAIRMDSTFLSSTISSNRLSSIGYLHLAYFATEITLHRRIIRALASDSQAIDPYLEHICRSAAKARLISAMDFVNRLTPQHLRAFWYFASKTNFALIGTFGSLLWATSPGREEADWYRRRLGEYRWTLSVSSKPGESHQLTEFAMGMLDISTGLLKKLPEKPELSRNGSAVDFSNAGRRHSLLSMGMSSFVGDTFSGINSADISAAQSPGSPIDSSDDEDYDYETFSPTGGMASMHS
ncbi:fungal-specific transcription factor domain-containing protein [Xylaria bambusicola]|uniref:fungal-specific transcription factor domain-containing protein n=1 Tax=Xylaria bambusicola TaxID=326684 RepID=UPI002008B456|nr:fungal-specific transcription factor domain-containing protein [Xylaria bambusicola]KAI0503120.1 fungal-specific transcription factor domain-containing protein [Xylaria bambusicola]